MPAVPAFNDATLQAICNILGATDTGLSGADIGRYLGECRIFDPNPQITKRHRLFQALREKQILDSCANNVLAFITHVMSPVRHVGKRDHFETERAKLNAVLSFTGNELGEDGQLRSVSTARTLTESEARATLLRKALVERRVHPDVIRFCKAELVADNYFHAVLRQRKALLTNFVNAQGLRVTVRLSWTKHLPLERLVIPA